MLASVSKELADLAERVLPCVVTLTGTVNGGETSGSGFTYDDAGHVVTNHHVVDGVGPTMTASLRGGPSQTATVLGSDPLTDLAVLRLEHPVRPHLKIRPAPARLGELCIALGSPLGIYPESVSLGIISGLARIIPQATGRPLERALQTDCAINPGNSGGPLVDVDGAVMGVNVSIDARGANLGFAIPAETVKLVADELIEHGSVTRASLGVSVAMANVDLDGQTVARLRVSRVKDAEHALRVGDVILAVAGEIVDERADLYNHLDRRHIGKPLELEVLRDGARTAVTVTPVTLVP